MTRPVEITQPSDFVSCDNNGKATVVFNVTDITGKEAKLGVKVIADAPAQESWFTLQNDSIWRLGANATDQITVDIGVPESIAPGKYNFRLMVYSVATPGELFTKGETVCCEVTQKAAEPEPVKKFPWWIVVVAVVVVLAVGGWGIWELTRDKEPTVEMVTLPRVVTKNALIAQQELAAAGLQLDLENSSVKETSVDSQVGTVIQQIPDPKTAPQVKKGSLVRLVVAVKKPLRVVVDPNWLKNQKVMIFSGAKMIEMPPPPKPKPQPDVQIMKVIPFTGTKTREVENAEPAE